MTIEVYGHVQSIEHAGAGHVLVRIQIEASRMPARSLGKEPIIEIYASAAEAEMYRPGTQIHMQIRPHTSTGSLSV